MNRKLIEGEVSVGSTGNFFKDLLDESDSLYKLANDLVHEDIERESSTTTTLIDKYEPDILKGFNVPKGTKLINHTPLGKVVVDGGTYFSKDTDFEEVAANRNYELLEQKEVALEESTKYDLRVLEMKYPEVFGILPIEQMIGIFDFITEDLDESPDELIDRGELKKENVMQWYSQYQENKAKIDARNAVRRFFFSMSEVQQDSVINLLKKEINFSYEEILNEIGYSITMEDIHRVLKRFKF